jgi:hypothetical protein
LRKIVSELLMIVFYSGLSSWGRLGYRPAHSKNAERGGNGMDFRIHFNDSP